MTPTVDRVCREVNREARYATRYITTPRYPLRYKVPNGYPMGTHDNGASNSRGLIAPVINGHIAVIFEW